ncbi:hypothetical protein C463_16866 [Halorubrum californiense DSM 19288]|uniref:Uncharacterized protein n=1 Tax=Halorubrum californiense DSM 19288 TaxID=1227465 RepID=M0DY70_9EURY|nr:MULTISPECIES: hypothetical protein [Halorubrum]ELZ39667.1 hypothetical protein C463_16866 [Halorubrum californiense DSM 19288]TKX67749.1 hypothetical protein EXE40_14455 [Halorubrum sp. GN11GM_10-3_MGM]
MGFHDELDDVLRPANRVLDGDLVDLERMSPTRRERLYEEIRESEERFESELLREYRRKLDDVTTSEVRSQLVTARLFLHVASHRDDRGDVIDPNAFEEDERRAVVEFDRYRAFDVSSTEDLQRRIREKDDDVYEFVVEEVTSQTDDRSSVLEGRDNRIRTAVMDYLNDRYQERIDRSEEAVSLYIQHHGLPNVIEGIENAVEATAEGAERRQEVEEAVRTQLDDLSERIHASLRDQERAIRGDIAGIQGEVAAMEGDKGAAVDTERLESKLDEVATEVEAVREERRADVAALDEAIDGLADKRETLDDALEELTEAGREATRRAADEAAEGVADDAEEIVSQELQRLRDRREELDGELSRLSRERERLEAAGDRLETEHEVLSERVDRVSASLPAESDADAGGDGVVPARIARLYEVDFVSRFDESVREAHSITLPSGEAFEPPSEFARRAHEAGDERERMASLLDEQGASDDVDVDHYPLRRRSRYTVVTSSRFGLVRDAELVIEATVHSNLEAYAINGFDARPAGLDDLLDVINRVTERANTRGVPHLIAAASTTGWTDRVRRLVTESEFSRTRLGTDVSLCLVDVRTGELFYDRSDDVVHANRELFERAVHVERVDACERHIREEYVEDPMTDTVRLSAVASELDAPEHVVASAFDRIEDAGDGSRGYHDEHGPYLVANGG